MCVHYCLRSLEDQQLETVPAHIYSIIPVMFIVVATVLAAC